MENLWYALKRNLPFPGVLEIKSVIGAELVILHRPLPVIPIFNPTLFIFSNRNTSAPASAAVTAAKSPATPPPMTAIFLFVEFI